MKLMYELAIKLIDIYILISSLFNKKLKEFMKEEKIPLNTLMKILIFKKNILIHVSSVGEFEQAKPIIDGLRSLNKFEIIVSFFSSSIENKVKEDKSVHHSFYLPSDSKKNMELLLEKINPIILLLIKYEYWRNLILSTNKKVFQ